MRIDDTKFWTEGTKILTQAIQVLAGEIEVNCEKIEMSAGDDVHCYLDAIDNNLELISRLRQRLYYFSDVAKVE